MRVTVEDGRAVKVAGDPDHETTRGFLCAKVNRYLDRTYSPDRVLHPMVRVGPKGEGRFERTDWDSALDLVSRRLGEIAARGAERVLPYSYSGTLGLVQNGSMDHRFFHRLGASQLDRTICSTCGSEALDRTLGRRLGPDPVDLGRANTVLLWGTNTLTSNVHQWPVLRDAQANGTRLVAIDPVRTRTAERADQWLPIHPGTDAALALGLMHVLFRDGLVDEEYVARATVGRDRLEREVRNAWPVRRASAITGLAAADIEALAARLAGDRRVAIRLNYGLQRHAGGGAAVRAIVALASVLGAWRHPGCGALLSTSGAFPRDGASLGRSDLMPAATPRTINMSRLGEALDPDVTADPPVEALFVYASNPAAVAPDQNAVLRGLAREDLFCVVHELFVTDTARYADVLLPATTQLEQWDIHTSYGHYYITANRPSIAPLGEAVSNAELFRRLARRMGFTEPCFEDDDRALMDQAFRWDDPRMHGITVERLLEEGPLRLSLPRPFLPFADPERPIDLAPEELPLWVPPVEIGEADAAPEHYPLALLSPPAHHFLNSTFVNLTFARRDEPEPRLQMHPTDAASRGLSSGDRVHVHNDRGHFTARLDVTDAVRPRVVCAPSIWWTSLADGDRNANAVTSQRLTDVGRGATFYDCAVEVRPAK
jgi:anaerobic selenocysteine-containing dehydrogenase